MNLQKYLCIAPAVTAALREGKPVVALADGLSASSNFIVTAPLGIQDGVLMIGGNFSADANCIAHAQIPVAVALKKSGIAGPSAAMLLASLAGIAVVAAHTLLADDAPTLGRMPVLMVCANCAVPEIFAQRDVPVLTLGSENCPDAKTAAQIAKTKWTLGLIGGACVIVENNSPVQTAAEIAVEYAKL